mgnify:CR=1 FL=1|tara:strand:- start:7435 stop:8541 length:1107 start_codon:yes stop_codon:yes gene_type:complete
MSRNRLEQIQVEIDALDKTFEKDCQVASIKAREQFSNKKAEGKATKLVAKAKAKSKKKGDTKQDPEKDDDIKKHLSILEKRRLQKAHKSISRAKKREDAALVSMIEALEKNRDALQVALYKEKANIEFAANPKEHFERVKKTILMWQQGGRNGQQNFSREYGSLKNKVYSFESDGGFNENTFSELKEYLESNQKDLEGAQRMYEYNHEGNIELNDTIALAQDEEAEKALVKWGEFNEFTSDFIQRVEKKLNLSPAASSSSAVAHYDSQNSKTPGEVTPGEVTPGAVQSNTKKDQDKMPLPWKRGTVSEKYKNTGYSAPEKVSSKNPVVQTQLTRVQELAKKYDKFMQTGQPVEHQKNDGHKMTKPRKR